MPSSENTNPFRWIKLKRDCSLGNKGQSIQVTRAIAKERVNLKHAVYIAEPASQTKRREEIEAKRIISNKALSA